MNYQQCDDFNYVDECLNKQIIKDVNYIFKKNILLSFLTWKWKVLNKSLKSVNFGIILYDEIHALYLDFY